MKTLLIIPGRFYRFSMVMAVSSKIGPPKSATSVRDVPLNDTEIEMINRLREEVYLGEDSPLIPNEKGDFIKPINLLRRFYRLQAATGIPEEELKGLHAFTTYLRHDLDQRNQAARRNYQEPERKAGCRSPRTHHDRDHRAVLCQEG